MGVKDICDALFSQLEEERITSSDLASICGLTTEDLQVLVEFGIIDPEGIEPSSWSFSYHCISIGRKASRLKRDFDLSPIGIALVLLYQMRISELEEHLREIECQLPNR